MSQLLIQQYLNQLRDLRRVSGTHRESVVSEAFKDLLKGWARQQDLIFVAQYEIRTPAKELRYVDGALLHALRVPFGYWEAKDEKDDLDSEIAVKLRRGYPQDNIIFEDSTQDSTIRAHFDTYRRRLQREGHRSPRAGDDGQRGDGQDHPRDAGGGAVRWPRAVPGPTLK